MRDNDWTRVLGWPGYKVYRHEIDEPGKRLKLWVRRKRANKLLVCSGCGEASGEIVASYEREVRDLPCFEYQTTVVIELYRVRCPDCGVKAEKVPLLPSKAPFSKRFEDAVGQACESAAASRVARQFGLAASTVRAIDQRYLARWAADAAQAGPAADGCGRDLCGQEAEVHHRGEQPGDRRAALVRRGAEEGNARRVLPKQLSPFQRGAVQAACVDMWEPFKQSIEQWLPNCRIIYDKFHIMQARQCGGRRGPREPSFSARADGAGTGQGQALAAADPLAASDREQKAATQRTVCPEPESDESLPAQRESGPAVDLSL